MELRPAVDERGPHQQNFGVQLERWQRMLRRCEPDLAAKYADTISHNLTDLWPHANEECYFSGAGVYPDYSQESGVVKDVYGRIDVMKGTSYGLVVRRPEGGRHQIYYSFYLGSASSEIFTSCRNEDYYAFVEADKAAIIPIGEVENVFKKDNVGSVEAESLPADLHEYLSEASDTFKALLHSRQFRRINRSRQLHAVADYIERVEQASAVRGREVYVAPERVLQPQLRDGAVQFDSVVFQEDFLTGVCLGVGSVEDFQLAKRAIRRDTDMTDSEAGLCLLVDVETINADVESEIGVVYVPISGQELRVTFSEPQA